MNSCKLSCKAHVWVVSEGLSAQGESNQIWILIKGEELLNYNHRIVPPAPPKWILSHSYTNKGLGELSTYVVMPYIIEQATVFPGSVKHPMIKEHNLQ